MRSIMLLPLLGVATAAMAQAPVQPGTPQDAPPAKQSVASKEDKIICRSTPVIGSLVASTKVCKTRREWTHDNDDLRARGPVGNCAGGSQGGSCGI